MENQNENERENLYQDKYERGKSIGEEITCKRIIRNILYDQDFTFHDLRIISGFNFDEIIQIDKEVSAARIGE